jgi:hypothetical protein
VYLHRESVLLAGILAAGARDARYDDGPLIEPQVENWEPNPNS